MLVERVLAKYRVQDADAIVSTLALSIERKRAEAHLPKNQMKLVPTAVPVDGTANQPGAAFGKSFQAYLPYKVGEGLDFKQL